ncbi:MAG: hypothetical protein AAFZ58_14590 [Pseudomonadota bacterium]
MLLVLRSLAIALVGATLVAVPITIRAWYVNPGRVFRDEYGTQWMNVAETFWSWFWPFLVLIGVVAAVVLLFRARRTSLD